MAVEKGAKTAVVWLLFTLPLSLLEGGVLSERPILDKRERGGPKWTAKMAQSLTASDTRPWSPRFSPCSGGLGLRSWAGGAPRGEIPCLTLVRAH